MRTQVTFILRLWIDPQAEPFTWEGQVECVTSGERTHVRSPQEVARFIESHAVASPGMESSPAGPGHWPVEETCVPPLPGQEQKRSER